MTAIIDYGAGNLKSVSNALGYLGKEFRITSDRDEIKDSTRVILPGVGAFGDAIKSLKERNLINTIYDIISDNKPFLGICLGMQMLFEESEESLGVSGLGIFKGRINKFINSELKIPHIGWNSVNLLKSNNIFDDSNEKYMYFVHSYCLGGTKEDIACLNTNYGINFISAITSGNINACQFHPEKSGEAGLNILERFTVLK